MWKFNITSVGFGKKLEHIISIFFKNIHLRFCFEIQPNFTKCWITFVNLEDFWPEKEMEFLYKFRDYYLIEMCTSIRKEIFPS